MLDWLKKLLTSGEPPLRAMEPQCVRYEWFTLRLPAGWQFTAADNRSFAASGPAGCAMEAVFAHIRGFRMAQFDKHRGVIVQIMRGFLRNPTAKEIQLPTGVLWMESVDTEAEIHVLKIALFHSRPRDQQTLSPPMLQVTVNAPQSAPGAPEGEPLKQLRTALRTMEWT